MSKGINRIIISDEHISNGQIIKFPQLLNGCEVYGLIANGNWVTLSVEMDEKVFLDVEDKVKNKQIHSGIKWVYGKVYNLQKGGISWHGWYTDTNRNNKKDENEEWVNNKPVEQISKIDLHNVQGNYTIQKTIQIKFDNKPYDTPALSWVEPFLIHPELHFSKKPKGIFIVPIAEPKIYRTDLLINNSPFDRKLQIPLPKTEKESQENENVVYYGENLIISAHVCTLLIPESAEFTVIIDQKVQHGSNSGFLGVKIDSYKTIYEKKVNGLKPENDNFWSEDLDYELVSYLSQYFKRAELLIPLAIDKKPEDQKEKTKRTFSVTLKHIYQAYSATNTDLKKLYPIQQGYLTIGYTDMENLLEIQNKEVDEYVEKAGDVLLQPNGEPCHYTWIKAHKEDEEITLFEEKKEGIKFDPIEIGLITGDVNPYLLTLSTNLKTEECKTQQHTKGADSVFYFPAKLSSEKQGIKIQKIDYSSVDLLIPYKYIRDHKALGMVNIFPFNYFWLNEKDVQKHVVMVDTCRYTIPVKINVYPDIEWEIAFVLTAGLQIEGSITRERKVLNWYHQKFGFRYIKRELNIEVTDSAKLQYDLAVCYSINGKPHKYGLKSIEKIIENAKYAYDSVSLSLKDLNPSTVEKGYKNYGLESGTLSKIDFSIDPPNIGFALRWQFDESQSGQMATVYKGGIALQPLIGIAIGIDLIPFIGKIPYVGTVFLWIKSIVEKLSESEIYITFEASMEVNWEGSWSYNTIDGFDNAGEQEAKIEVGIKIKVGIKPRGTVMATSTQPVKLKWMVDGEAGTSFVFTQKIGYDRQKSAQYKESSVIWGGAKITIKIYELVLSKSYNLYKENTLTLFDEREIYNSGKEYIEAT
ncbi:hypothetical protein [Apibacter sp. B2966]|uniref:hypothetical protein n=1 Tax=Apibacter sp. B2966 TaxID=2656761 RepID=UPI00140CCBC2|nr:hypothetical protein [Apibacter sp. B2966]QII71498.1 hypothetical protein G8C43_01480 [Apibacter sp. B2966]